MVITCQLTFLRCQLCYTNVYVFRKLYLHSYSIFVGRACWAWKKQEMGHQGEEDNSPESHAKERKGCGLIWSRLIRRRAGSRCNKNWRDERRLLKTIWKPVTWLHLVRLSSLCWVVQFYIFKSRDNSGLASLIRLFPCVLCSHVLHALVQNYEYNFFYFWALVWKHAIFGK